MIIVHRPHRLLNTVGYWFTLYILYIRPNSHGTFSIAPAVIDQHCIKSTNARHYVKIIRQINNRRRNTKYNAK